MMLWTDLEALVEFARLHARRDVYDGTVSPRNMRQMRKCQHLFSIDPLTTARLIYTRDVGHHSGGWWKNPDYERCLHLSISFLANPINAPLPFDRKAAERISTAFFEDDARMCWIEPPYSAEGKACDVHHYRLFCDERWRPILPRGEVYSRELTPMGWKSFSELHGWSPTAANAPWLKAASE